jgi:hypothetical protein
MTAIASLICWGCGNPELTTSSPAPNTTTSTNSTTTTSTTTPKTPIESPNNAAKVIAIGNIKELEDNSVCGKAKVTYAYGETSNYRVYICADDKEADRPRYYISRNKDGSGGLDMEATNYNPQQNGAIEFKNEGYIYTLESPTTQNPEPVLRVTLPNGTLSKEQLLRYLSRSSTTSTTTSTTKSSTSTSSDPLQYVLQNRESLGICKDNFQAEATQKGMGSKAFQISDKKYLVQIQCFLAAYQGAFEYVLWSDDSPKPSVVALEFDSFAESKAGEKPKRITSRTISGMPRVNVQKQTMTNFTKFRGVGDCGSSALYKLDGDRMVLQEYRAKYECDGKYVQDFPVIYP